MKTLNQKLTTDKAQKELRQFSILGLLFGIVPLLAFGWLGIAGLAASARALVLSNHPGNKGNPKLTQYKTMAVAGLILSLLDVVLMTLVKG